MRIIQIGFFALLMSCLFCNCTDSNIPCTSSIDNLITHAKTDVWTYTGGQEVLIDVNNDNNPDFKCVTEPAGNRSRKKVVPIGSNNQITGVLGSGVTVGPNTAFTGGFDFNDLGTGANAYLINQYFGVKFKVNNDTHYGWIKFSSNADGSMNSNTPIYYHNITIEVKETGYNEGCNMPVVTGN